MRGKSCETCNGVGFDIAEMEYADVFRNCEDCTAKGECPECGHDLNVWQNYDDGIWNMECTRCKWYDN